MTDLTVRASSALPGPQQPPTNDAEHELREVLRQILRDPAQTKLFSGATPADETSSVWANSHVFDRESNSPFRRDLPNAGASEKSPEPGDRNALRDAFGVNRRQKSSPAVAYAAMAGIIFCTLFGAGYFGFRYSHRAKTAAAAPATLSADLNLSFTRDRKGLVLHWNDASAVLAGASQAMLHIDDGGKKRDLTLAPDQLRSGTVVYFPASKNVRFQLEVARADNSRSIGDWLQAGRQPRAQSSQPKPRRLPVPPQSTVAGNPAPKNPANDEASHAAFVPPKLLHSAIPRYPDAARIERAWGLVTVQGEVGTDGRVKNAVALIGPPILRDSALDAVEQFVYEPATVGGRPTESAVKITFNFVPTK